MKTRSILLLLCALFLLPGAAWAIPQTDKITFTWKGGDATPKSFYIAATNGESFTINWGIGATETKTGTGADQPITQPEAYNDTNDHTVTITAVNSDCSFTSFRIATSVISVLDVSGAPALNSLECASNQLTALNLSANTALTSLDCSDNKLTSLGVSANTSLLTLNCYNNELASLDVSANTSLLTLNCYNNELASLDVSANTSLVGLLCNDNELTSLDVSANTALTTLNCSRNKLTSLDVSANTSLLTLNCYNNELTSLDLSTNTSLISLLCFDNELTSLNLSPNTSLNVLRCYGNKLSLADLKAASDQASLNSPYTNKRLGTQTLDVLTWAKHTATLDDVFFGVGTGFVVRFNDEPVTDDASYYTISGGVITFKQSGLYSIEITNPTGLPSHTDYPAKVIAGYDVTLPDQITFTWKGEGATPKSFYITATRDKDFTVDWGDGTEAEIETGTGADQFIEQPTAYGNTNDYTVTITAAAGSLRGLFIDEKEVSVLDITGAPALTSLYCYDNDLTALDVSTNTALISLYCYSNELTSLDLSTNTSLVYLYCFNNELTSLDVSNNKALRTLSCYNNQLESLDVSTNTALVYLYCFNNELTSLDVSANTSLTTLGCYNNDLTALDLSTNTALTYLICANNDLTALNLSTNTDLTELSCANNDLTALDLSTNTALTWLDCFDNDLTALDLSTNTALTELICSYNKLTALDLSTNTALTILDCANNDLTALNLSANTSLTWLDCFNNKLSLADLKAVSDRAPIDPPYTNKRLGTQTLDILDWTSAIATIDEVFGGVGTGFVVRFNDEPVTDASYYIISGGVITFKKSGLYSIEITNPTGLPSNEDYPAKVIAGYDVTMPDQIIFTWQGEGATQKVFSIIATRDKDFIVDWGMGATEINTGTGGNQIITQPTAYGDTDEHTVTITAINSDCSLMHLDVEARQVSVLDVTGAPALTRLHCSRNKLTSLDVSANTALTHLLCFDNELTSLDVSANTSLTTLDCANNDLTALDVSTNTLLEYLCCEDNDLAALDLSANTALTQLLCLNNKLTVLDLSANTVLTILYCDNNDLTTLDLSANTALTLLYCDNNDLTALDVSVNTALTQLLCPSNKLTVLDLSTNTALTLLDCFDNDLTALVLSANTSLTWLDCSNNKLSLADLKAVSDRAPIDPPYTNKRLGTQTLDILDWTSAIATIDEVFFGVGTGFVVRFNNTTVTGEEEYYTITGDVITFKKSGLYSIEITNPTGLPSHEDYPATVIAGYEVTLSQDATLSDLSVDGETIEGFSAGTTEYEVTVGYDVEEVTITATANDTKATVSGDTGTKELAVGLNTFTITVTAEDTGVTKDYTVNVRRGSNDATLSYLAVSKGSLSPVFNKNTTYYTVEVANEVTEIGIAAIATHVNAKVSVTGPNPLELGNNLFAILVTAEDGQTTMSYRVIVTREEKETPPDLSSDGTLVSLTVSEGTLTPQFASFIREYTVEVGNEISEIEIEAITKHPRATVSGDGVHSLRVGENTLAVIGRAEDGKSRFKYTVTVIRAAAPELSDDATLASLNVSTGTLSPAFDKNTLEYTVEVESGVTEITISADATDANAKLSGADTFPLEVGENTFKIIVTAEDGETTKTYTITVTRLHDTAIDDVALFRVYPNPATDKVFVETNKETEPDVSLFSLNGTLLIQKTGREINVSHLAPGMYIIQVNGERMKLMKK